MAQMNKNPLNDGLFSCHEEQIEDLKFAVEALRDFALNAVRYSVDDAEKLDALLKLHGLNREAREAEDQEDWT